MAERQPEKLQVGVSESPGLTTARHPAPGAGELPGGMWPPADALAGKPGHCKGPDFVLPEVPHNVAGTLGDLLQAGRTSALDRRGLGTWGCGRTAQAPAFQAGHAGSTPVILSYLAPGQPPLLLARDAACPLTRRRPVAVAPAGCALRQVVTSKAARLPVRTRTAGAAGRAPGSLRR